MNVTDATALPQLPGSDARKRPQNPEEAARRFEEVLVRQFVETMTDGLFDAGLSGDDGPGWMGAYGSMQKDALADVLTDHLVDSGTFGLREMLLRQWRGAGMAPADGDAPAEAPTRVPGDPSLRIG